MSIERFLSDKYGHAKPALTLNLEAIKKYKDDLIDLSIGDTDLVTDEKIIQAAFDGARAGYTRYGVPKGDPQLIKKIQQVYKEDYNMDLSEDEIAATPSTLMGMALLMLAIINPQDEVIVFEPFFSCYKAQIELPGGNMVTVPTYKENNLLPVKEDLEKAITSKTKAIIVNNPTNPTGAVYNRQTLEMIAQVAKEHDLLVVADEIYTFYIYEGEFIPIRSLEGMKERTVTLNSFSKNFMMTGWRAGFVIAEPQLVKTMISIDANLVYSTPSISQRAAIKALDERQYVKNTYIPIYKERRDIAMSMAKEIPWMKLDKVDGTFYAFPYISGTGLSSVEFCNALLEKCHIVVIPGSAFGKSGEGFVRMALTVSTEKVREAFERMKKVTF